MVLIVLNAEICGGISDLILNIEVLLKKLEKDEKFV